MLNDLLRERTHRYVDCLIHLPPIEGSIEEKGLPKKEALSFMEQK